MSFISRLVRLPPLLILMVAIGACDSRPTGPGDDPWTLAALEPLGLEGHWVRALAVDEERIYAGTREGLFARGRTDGGWTSLGLEGVQVNAILPGQEGSLLVAVRPSDPQEDPASLFRSPDGGETWEPDQRGFGGESGPYEVESLARLPDGTLLAGGASPVVARLEPDGDRWRPVWKDWGTVGLGTHFVTVDPTDASVIWAGGELAAFQPFLAKSADGGDTWDSVSRDADGDNAIYSLTVNPRDADIAFAGWEGRVKRTHDGGETWETVLRPERYPYFYGLAVSPTTPGRVYAAGARNDPALQDLIFHWSDDNGQTWSSVREEGGGGALSMLLTAEERILVGTQDGVYRVVADD